MNRQAMAISESFLAVGLNDGFDLNKVEALQELSVQELQALSDGQLHNRQVHIGQALRNLSKTQMAREVVMGLLEQCEDEIGARHKVKHEEFLAANPPRRECCVMM